LSLADIALCSMLGPVLAPANSPWADIANKPDIDPQLLEARAALAQRPLGEYVLAMYATHRNSQDNWRGEW
jgi:glutathione S-transferase